MDTRGCKVLRAVLSTPDDFPKKKALGDCNVHKRWLNHMIKSVAELRSVEG